ncbi:UNKNOWN [Stylonychia lemnae]|uniref:Uncharacterized protein n=1 Tax=Stylonychia lemnae TaxID=5949 RepID=A0A078AJ74_STYLE|nr:UNKNOWN [Stylonychia lemnae]|eukprot:CDW82365.1 UNKNOWN [Stylonychia lemnae]
MENLNYNYEFEDLYETEEQSNPKPMMMCFEFVTSNNNKVQEVKQEFIIDQNTSMFRPATRDESRLLITNNELSRDQNNLSELEQNLSNQSQVDEVEQIRQMALNIREVHIPIDMHENILELMYHPDEINNMSNTDDYGEASHIWPDFIEEDKIEEIKQVLFDK